MAYQKLQAGRASVVTKSDTDNIPDVSGGENNGCVLYIGSAGEGGALRVLTVGGDDVTFYGVQSGTFFPVQVLRVFDTDTTATNIVALW